eukprot:s2538_g35.t1
MDRDALVYLGPETFISRRAELQHRKPSRELTIDANCLVVKDKRPQLTCATTTELEVVNALRRRSLTFDLVKLVDYDKFNAYCSELVERLTLAPPPNYSPVSVQQVLGADRAAFLYMAEKLSALKRDARNQSPLEKMLASVLSHSSVSFHLLPLPKSSEPKKKPDTPRKRVPSRDRSGSPPIPKQRRAGLKGALKTRVALANELYEVTCKLILVCEEHGEPWSCENPGRSFVWQTTHFEDLLRKVAHLQTTFHHCRHGSGRRKLIRLAHTLPTLAELELHCQNDHEHEPWGQLPDGSWATGDETAYPWDLCRSMAFQMVMFLQTQGAICATPSFAKQEETIQALRASPSIQPRKSLPPMVSEFREEFVHEALRIGHPSEVSALFPRCVRKAVDTTLSKSRESMAKERTAELRRWASLVEELKGREAAIRSEMSNRRSTVLKDKKLALFEKLICESGHQDLTLVSDLARGFDLTREPPRSGVFQNHLRPAKVSCENVRSLAKLSKDSILRTVTSSGDGELDSSLWEATRKEVKKGFLEGLLNVAELPVGFLLTKRFPVKQKNKVRPIDDYKANMGNQSATQTEGVTVHTIDHVASMVAYLLKASKGRPSRSELRAKCWDLSDAYKQIPLSDQAHESDAFLAVYFPESGVAEVFRQRVLPFRKDGARLRGRLQFANAQLLGRAMRGDPRDPSRRIASGRKELSQATVNALENLSSALPANKARQVSRGLGDYVHIYVDASFEASGYSGVGGLCVSSCGEVVGFFNERVPDELLLLLQGSSKETAILELEMIAISVAIHLWRPLLSSKRVIVFTDNDPVKSSIIRGYSQNQFVDCLMGDLFKVEDTFNCQVWLERVPSQSNPADVPSWEECDEVLGSKNKLRVDVMEVWVKAAHSTGGDSAAKA